MPIRAPVAALIAALISCFGCILLERDVTSVATNPPLQRFEAQQALELTVVTLNVHDLYLAARDRPLRMRLIGGALAGLEADVVSLQEAFIGADRKILLRQLEGSRLAHHAYFDYGKVGSGLLLLSAHPIVETDFREFTNKGKWYKPWHGDWWAGKGVALARIRLPEGDIDVYQTHAHAAYNRSGADDEYLSVRLAQHRELIAFIDATTRPADPALALGDFNSAAGSQEYDILLAEGGLQPMLTVPTRFDHVFAKAKPCLRYRSDPTKRIRSAAIEGGEPIRLSDHDGYVARITIERQACAEAAAR
jgi:endonuclease/exonuclease/phosphatase family metal-dependent hydrolase